MNIYHNANSPTSGGDHCCKYSVSVAIITRDGNIPRTISALFGKVVRNSFPRKRL